jgi:putative glycosyltransferase
MRLSIVTTLYRSAPYIKEFVERTLKAAATLTSEYEVIIVNDGSPDNALELAISLCKDHDRIKVVNLSRNFGHHPALIAGLQHAAGETIFLIDCDLEEEPELVVDFWREFSRSPSIDVLYGVQRSSRKGGWFQRVTGRVFYAAFRFLADDAELNKNICTVRMMTKSYVNALLQFEERDYYFGPICSLAGFDQRPFAIDKKDKGSSTYSLLMKYHLFINCILAFSKKPLYAIFYVGILVMCIAAVLTINVLARKVLYGIDVEGYASLFIAVCFLGGLNIFFVGLVAIYISKILAEVKRRPLFLVKDVVVSPVQGTTTALKELDTIRGLESERNLVTPGYERPNA